MDKSILKLLLLFPFVNLFSMQQTEVSAGRQIALSGSREEKLLDAVKSKCKFFKRPFYNFRLKKLIETSDINTCDLNGRTPLNWACTLYFDNQRLKMLLKAGANPDLKSTCDGQAPIHHACSNKKLKKFKLLLNAGADVNIKDNYGKTPLIMASERGIVEIVEMLIKSGASIDEKDSFGHDALYYAKHNYGNLSHGGWGHSTAIHQLNEVYCSECRRATAIKKLLLDAGAQG